MSKHADTPPADAAERGESATSRAAYREVLQAGDDVTQRRRVAAAIGETPMTIHELDDRLAASNDSLCPRVNELVRRGCVRRQGTRETPSGNDAYVHHLTPLGEQYVRGEANPEPAPTLSERKAEVVRIAREVVRGNADVDVLHLAVDAHDIAYRRHHPEWDGGLASTTPDS